MKHSAYKYSSSPYPPFCAIFSRWPNKRIFANEKIEHSQQCNWKAGFLFSLAPRAPSAGHTQRSPPILNSTSLPPSSPPPPTSAPASLPHIFSLLFNCERVGRTLKLASCHPQVLSDEIQVDNCGCACSRPIGGESWRPTMYFCTSSLLCLMISVNSPKW